MSAIDWLLDSDPAIRWQVMSDLTGEPAEIVSEERDRVAVEGWGALLLSLQEPDGRWDGGTYRPGWVDDSKPFFDAWTATHFSLQLLREYGLDPESAEAGKAVSSVRDNVRWHANDALYFDGETEPCINGVALATGVYFGEEVGGIGDLLLGQQLDDGGWNCWAEYGASVSSFHTTICVLEGLSAWQRSARASDAAVEAIQRGEEYLLERRLFRRRSDGKVIDPRFTLFSYPTWWYYDVLRGLDYFRIAHAAPDDRCAEAIDLVLAKRDPAGRWALENVHQGPTHFDMDSHEGAPSRWNTLRASRVLDWAAV